MTAVSGDNGTSSARSRWRTWPVSMISQGVSRPPTSSSAMVAMGFCVADRPMRTGGLAHRASSRSSDSARWAPRLEPAMACSSSTITLRTLRSMSRPESEDSRMNSDSGVVTRMCGGARRCRSRSNDGVSPVRTASRIDRSPSPMARTRWRMPSSGACRFFWMSLDRALSGDT